MTTDTCLLAVCGAHMDGLALNDRLRDRSANLVERTSTSNVMPTGCTPSPTLRHRVPD